MGWSIDSIFESLDDADEFTPTCASCDDAAFERVATGLSALDVTSFHESHIDAFEFDGFDDVSLGNELMRDRGWVRTKINGQDVWIDEFHENVPVKPVAEAKKNAISEDAMSFKIVEIFTDKFLSDEGYLGEGILNLIEQAKEPGMDVMYISGDVFSARASVVGPEQPRPAQPGTLDDADEFHKHDIDVGGVLVYYTGIAEESDIVEILVNKFRVDWGYGDEWLDVLTWH